MELKGEPMSLEEHKRHWHPAYLPLKYEYPVYIPPYPTDQLGQLELQEESLEIENDRQTSDHNGLGVELNEDQPNDGNDDGKAVEYSPDNDDLNSQIDSVTSPKNDNLSIDNHDPFSTEDGDRLNDGSAIDNAIEDSSGNGDGNDDLNNQIDSSPLHSQNDTLPIDHHDPSLTRDGDQLNDGNDDAKAIEHLPSNDDLNNQINSPQPENDTSSIDNHVPFSTQDDGLLNDGNAIDNAIGNSSGNDDGNDDLNNQINAPPQPENDASSVDNHNPFSTQDDDGFLASISQNNTTQTVPHDQPEVHPEQQDNIDPFATSEHLEVGESFFDKLATTPFDQSITAPEKSTAEKSAIPFDSLLEDDDELLDDVQDQAQTDFSFLQDDDLLDEQEAAPNPSANVQPIVGNAASTAQKPYRPSPAAASASSSFWQPLPQINTSTALNSAQQSAAPIKVDRKGTNAYDFPMDVLETERKIEASLHSRVQSSQPSPVPSAIQFSPAVSQPPQPLPPPPAVASRSDSYGHPPPRPAQPYQPITSHPVVTTIPLPPKPAPAFPGHHPQTNVPPAGAPALGHGGPSSAAGLAPRISNSPTTSRYSPAAVASPSIYAPHTSSKPPQPPANAPSPSSPSFAYAGAPYTPTVPTASGGAGARSQRYGPPHTPGGSIINSSPAPSVGQYRQQQQQPPQTGYQQVSGYPAAAQSVPVLPTSNNAGIRPPPLTATSAAARPPFSPPQARRIPGALQKVPSAVAAAAAAAPPSHASGSPVSAVHHPMLPRRHMLLCWGCNGRIVTVSQPEISFGTSTSGEIHIRKTRDLVSLPDALTKFPGPLFAPGNKKVNKQRSKDVEKWLTTSIEVLEGQIFNKVADEQLATQDLIALYKVLRLFLIHDFNLPATPEVAKELNDIFHPVSSKTVDESNSFQTSADLYIKQQSNDLATANAASLTAGGTSLNLSDVETIEGFLAKGDKAAAVYYALDKHLYSHALVIGSISGPDIWQTAIKEFIGSEVTNLGSNAESLAAVYRVFAGFGSRSFDHLDSLTNWSPSGHSRQWQTALTSILCNRTPNDKEGILALGQKFAAEGATFAAHICFLFAYPLIQCSSLAVSQKIPSFQLVGSPDPVSTNLEAICLTETYEYIMTLASPAHAVPFNHTLIFKFYHGLALADYGYVAEASRYLENVLSLLKVSSGKVFGADLLILKVRERLQLLSDNPSLEQLSASWLSRKIARPKLDKMWTQLDKSFTKFVAGDGVENETGPGTISGGQRGEERPGNKERGQDIRFGKIAAESEAVGITRVPSSVVISQQPSALNLRDAYPLPTSPGAGIMTPREISKPSPMGGPPHQPYPARPVANGGSRSRSYAPASEVTSRPSSAQLRYSYSSSVTDITSLAGGNSEIQSPSLETNGAPAPPPHLRHAQSARGLTGRYQASNRRVVSTNSMVPSEDGYPLPEAEVGTGTHPRQQGDDMYYNESSSLTDITAPTPATFSLHAGSSVASDIGAAGPNQEQLHESQEAVAYHEEEEEPYGFAPPVYEPPSYEPDAVEANEQEGEEQQEEDGAGGTSGLATPDDDTNRRYEPEQVYETNQPPATEPAKKEEQQEDEKPQEETPKKGRWFSWLHRNNAEQSLQDQQQQQQQPKAIRAKLGEESKFYYDKELKRWVNKSAKLDNEGPSALPPPPKAAVKKPSPAAATPPPDGGSVASGPPLPPAVKPSQPPPSASASTPPLPPATKATANLDDLLAAPPATTGQKRSGRKNARNRYVDIMENK